MCLEECYHVDFKIVSQTTEPVVFQILTCKKVENIWHLSFQEERLNMDWNGCLDGSIGKSTRLVIRGSNPGSGSNFSLEI